MTETDRFPWQGAPDDLPSADLLRECGWKLTDKALWQKFQGRFHKLIFTYLLRAMRERKLQDSAADLVGDFAQDVYIRLVQNDGRMLRSFKGSSNFSVMAFLARVCMSVVSDYHRYRSANKREAQVIPIDRTSRTEALPGEAGEFDLNSILSWIDVERLVESDADRKNAVRNVLIFKLHYMDGFTAAEISHFPGFDLSESGIEVVIRKLTARVRKRMGK